MNITEPIAYLTGHTGTVHLCYDLTGRPLCGAQVYLRTIEDETVTGVRATCRSCRRIAGVETLVHRPDPDDGGWCVCGGQTVYFEDGDNDGYHGEGCEVHEHVYPAERKRIDEWREEREFDGGLASWNVTVFSR